MLTCDEILFLRSKLADELAGDQLEDGVTVFLFDVLVFLYLPFDNENFLVFVDDIYFSYTKPHLFSCTEKY